MPEASASAIRSTFQFADKASLPKNAIALIFDLEGFTRFFNQPDVQDYVPVFLNHVSREFSAALFGGKASWTEDGESIHRLNLTVAHEKFMGDGGLYVLLPPAGQSDFNLAHLSLLCNRLWLLKGEFHKVIDAVLERVPVAELPRKIRFGLSRGTVYELPNADGGPSEYIGFCINLASRLQSYCRDLGFIASARLMIPQEKLAQHGYRKVVATRLKGFSSEIVIVDADEFDALDGETKAQLFRAVND